MGLSAPSHGYFLIVAPSGEYPGFMTWESAPGSGRFIDVPGAGVLLLDITRR